MAKLKKKLEKTTRLKRLVHWTTVERKVRSNAAFLVGCFCLLKLNMKPEEVTRLLESNNQLPYHRFQDTNGSE
jgi:hypothetical protein